MIQLPELTHPFTAKTIALVSRTWEIGEQVYAAVTSDRAQSIYRTIRRAAVTTILLSIASILLLIDGAKAIHQWAQAHADWQYEDFEKVATDKIQAAVAAVKGVLKEQRDRASLLVKATAQQVESAARLKVAELGQKISDRALEV
ncbi:MAG: hypothetical protein KME42_13815 [Tildeniella nuda ZEHNDER 1965/U140]|jgi:hypothetical protein|nr:hypothetical protein [Tildeniella nuda ZEHNDER 1965/U140]